MGLCSSVPRNANEDMKLKLSFGSKSEKLVIPPTSIKGQQQQQPQNGWSTARSTTTFTDHGSKEEAFFDSKAWLDSDCEDDFYSVNGDFTPSRGTTPVHHTFGTPSRNRIHGSMAETSPEKKKKLLELFRESVKDDQGDVHGHKEVKPTIQDVIMPKSAHCTPYLSEANSACSSERTMSMSEDRSSIREKSVKSLQWCIPSLSSCRSFRERRPKTSPAVEVNGKH
ncbi:hypothetical protein AAZX31_19G067100 [Glycine max]|uniref:Uncharacterized protein n=3 Tax=Glycine subgen. Soja TaxID=1462606 RepID=I1N7D2_SOYBN|nr:uncharacterized protein LOC100306290 [Glycine max]XP_028218187.1 uncharacterized protein At3g27210-like [Glycine soja]KAG4395927.1 hypothetical protein GLYMA_19G074200v4 [Glycine max]KAG4915230.1 hypothetical protein JHK87_052787 [Glycine soja]KAH1076778.1 hypothetical protein GYH30_052334 [Glycine max]KAH1076779.1 hypothetical protein GYH30_052334 [Glycine max]KAH1193492.1 Uncharacterized protein GmHk_19G054525 [Glycine max]|eukprot:NP_001236542.2 uncharacterized protein LOC100306290 [Glycine max]